MSLTSVIWTNDGFEIKLFGLKYILTKQVLEIIVDLVWFDITSAHVFR